jgi:glutathione peroxidase-family protein
MDGANSSCTNPFTSVYDISVNAIGGGYVSMSEYRDKVLLIVNVASK